MAFKAHVEVPCNDGRAANPNQAPAFEERAFLAAKIVPKRQMKYIQPCPNGSKQRRLLRRSIRQNQICKPR
jgi:hypothetical protein